MSGTPAATPTPAASPSVGQGLMAGLMGAADKLEKLFEYLDGKMSVAHGKGSQSFRFAKKVFVKLLPLWTFLPFWLVALSAWALLMLVVDAHMRSFGMHVGALFTGWAPLFTYITIVYTVQAIGFKALYAVTEIPDAIFHKNMLDTNRDLRDEVQPWFYGAIVFIAMMFITGTFTFLVNTFLVRFIMVAFSFCTAVFVTSTHLHKQELKREEQEAKADKAEEAAHV